MSRFLFLLLLSSPLPAQTATGPAAPGLGAFDKIITDAITNYAIPGASLSITYNGRLVLARGYGFQDSQNGVQMQPDSMFRIASNSKQITAVAIMKLVEAGKLSLDAKAFTVLSDLQPPPGKTVDPRTANITIRHLLEHAGGYDRDISLDPMFDSAAIAKDLGVESPAGSVDIIRWMLGRPLDFNPGERSAYSNFGYNVLGRVIEKVTGVNYEMWVRNNVLAPMGVTQMRQGNTLAFAKLPTEVKYSAPGSASSVFPAPPAVVSWPYGGWYIEAMDSHGGWVTSTVELLKFWNAIEGRRGPAFLTPASVTQITANPGIPGNTASDWYGFGFEMAPETKTGVYWFHSGFLDGQTSYVVRSSTGWDYAVVFNGTPNQQVARQETGKNVEILTALDPKMTNALATVTWPATVDYFPMFATPPAGQPMLQAQGGAVNGASFQRGIVSGSWVTLFGANLAGGTRIWGGPDFVGNALPKSLDGVTVQIDGKPAAVYFISPTQLNVQAPAGLTTGYVTVEAFYNGVSSGVIEAEVKQAAPAFFTYGPGATRYVAAQFADYATAGDPTVVPGTRAAKPGDSLALYATALAPSPAGVLIGAPAALAPLPAIRIGGTPATVTYAGLTAAGLYQINVVVPNVPDGGQPITFGAAAAASPPLAVLTVRR